MTERNAGGPRGGLSFSWHKRPGWVCVSRAVDRKGRVRAMWVRPSKPQLGECSDCGRPGPAFEPCRYCGPAAKPRRGALAAEQGSLL